MPTRYLPPRLRRPIAALAALRRGLHRLGDRLVPPQQVALDALVGLGKSAGLRAIVRAGVPRALAAGPRSAGDLATELGLEKQALTRALRALVAIGFFRRRRDGRYAHNRASRVLVGGEEGSLAALADYLARPENLAAWAQLERSLATGAGAFEAVHGRDVWSFLAADAPAGDAFAGAMAELTALEAGAVACAYPFDRFRRLCDLGGGDGALLEAILTRYAAPHALLFDAAPHVARGLARLARAGLGERVEGVAGDFFVAIPAGCDGYLLKSVLHDWDDERALAILANCRRAMEPGARLLLVEFVVEADTAGGLGPLADLQMLVLCSGGRERGREEFRRLLEAAGFELLRLHPTALEVAILEARPRSSVAPRTNGGASRLA